MTSFFTRLLAVGCGTCVLATSGSVTLADEAPTPSPREVTATDSAASAPRLEVGRYVTRLPAGGKTVHLGIRRTLPRSAIWVGLTTDLPATGSAYLNATLVSPQGYDCDDQSATNATSQEATTTSLNVTTGEKDEFFPACVRGRSLDLTVAVDGVHRAGTPVYVTVVEQPPLRSVPSTRPARARWRNLTLQGAVSPVSGGTSPVTAPLLDERIHRISVPAGRVRYFKVPVDWGQQLVTAARVETSPAGLGTDRYLGTSIISPVGGFAGADLSYVADGPSPYAALGDGIAQVATGTSEISPRWAHDYDLNSRSTSLPGYYVIGVSVSGPPRDIDVPVVLRAEVYGKRSGVPTFDGAFPPSTAGGPTGVGTQLATRSAAVPSTPTFWDRFGWYRRGASALLLLTGLGLAWRGLALQRRRRVMLRPR